MFVFNDGALCWGFPHFLPLMVLIPRGAGGWGELGPDWVGRCTVPVKLQMISGKFIAHVFGLETGPCVLCG